MYIKKAKCPHCEAKYKDNRGLAAHVRFKHPEDGWKSKPMTPAGALRPKRKWPLKKAKQCPHCKKSYKNIGMLRKHMDKAHPGATEGNLSRQAKPVNGEPKSHLALAIAEIQDELQKITQREDDLRDALDALILAQETIKDQRAMGRSRDGKD